MLHDKFTVKLFVSGTALILSACCVIPFPTYQDYLRENVESPQREKQAKEMVAPADAALVYYYRAGNYRPVGERPYKLYIDGRCSAASLWPLSFYVFKLPPGQHVFETHGSELTLDAAGGEIYFIKEEGNFLAFNVKARLVDKEEGRKRIRESRLIRIDAASPCGLPVRSSGADIKNAHVPAGMAIVYLYRKSSGDDDYHDALVQLDGGTDRELAAGTFLFWQLAPGTHTIGSGDETVTLNAKAGEKYYVHLDTVTGPFRRWRHPMQLVKQEEGRREVEPLLLMEGPGGSERDRGGEERIGSD